MIIWGSRGKFENLGPVGSQHCPICEQERHFQLTVSWRYGHIFWIPMFNWQREYHLLCTHCSNGLTAPDSVVQTLLTENPLPTMHRFGWAIIGGIILFLAIISSLG